MSIFDIYPMSRIDNQMPEPRITYPGLKVLSCFVSASGKRLSGADITRATGVTSGTLYPLLYRYEDAGWLKSEWEIVDASAVGRPRQRLYTLTGKGKRAASNALMA